MNCISGNVGQFLCINRNCLHKNSYVCADPRDDCKENHECCSLISLSYLLKKSKNQLSFHNPEKSSPNKFDLLFPLYEKAKTISSNLSLALASNKLMNQINCLLESEEPLSGDDKDKIAKFMNDRKFDTNSYEGLTKKIEKQLEQFQGLINEFNLTMKEKRSKQIDELKKKIMDEEKKVNTATQNNLPVESRAIEQKVYNREKSRKLRQEGSKLRDSRTLRNMESDIQETPVKSKTMSMKMNGFSNLQKQKKKQEITGQQVKPLAFIGPSPVKSRIPQGMKSGVKLMGFGLDEKISTILKHHVPKAPLFSKITNDSKTINAFFKAKITKANLLYRASQHDFSAYKFHELCDGHTNTLTIVITEHDKIIGGYTPLPWKTGSGQWYPDEEQKSFIFNLSSGEKYSLMNKDKAIWCSRSYGPSFGYPDLEIADKAIFNTNSCANFPMCYNNGNYTNTPGSTQLFCGTKSGHFRIREWEVYELVFA